MTTTFTLELVGQPPMSERANFDAVFVGALGLCGEIARIRGVDRASMGEGVYQAMAGARALRFAQLCTTAGIDGVNGKPLSNIVDWGLENLEVCPDFSLDVYAQALASMPYQEYLRTTEWHETRWIALALATKRCQVCNRTGLLDVHHRTYERRGMELAADLTVLCRRCHERHHKS